MAGHFQLLVSRRTTAMVEVHCMAKAKKIISASAPPRVMSWCRAVCRLQRLRAGIRAVERAHGADHHLARQHAGQQADADLPVEAQRRNRRLDEVAEPADEAVGQLRRGRWCPPAV